MLGKWNKEELEGEKDCLQASVVCLWQRQRTVTKGLTVLLVQPLYIKAGFLHFNGKISYLFV